MLSAICSIFRTSPGSSGSRVALGTSDEWQSCLEVICNPGHGETASCACTTIALC